MEIGRERVLWLTTTTQRTPPEKPLDESMVEPPDESMVANSQAQVGLGQEPEPEPEQGPDEPHA